VFTLSRHWCLRLRTGHVVADAILSGKGEGVETKPGQGQPPYVRKSVTMI
jgi:hypothetical protein